MTPDDISTIEKRLNFTLPDTYRETLLTGVLVDGADPAPYFLQDPKELMISNLELRFLEGRHKFGDACWSETDINIGSDMGENYYGLRLDDPQCAVRSFSYDDGAYEIRYQSLPEFFDYLADLFQKHPQLKSPPSAAESPWLDMSVTRTKVPRESVLDPILLEEWTAFVIADPDLELRGFEMRNNPFTNQQIRLDDPGLAVLTVGESEKKFLYRYGRITVSNPDSEVIAKLQQAAAALDACVMNE